MSEASQHAFRFVVRTVDGVEYKFQKPTPRDRQAILNRLAAERKEKLRANGKEAGLTGAQIFNELEEFDDRQFGEDKWIDHVNTAAGKDEICEAAWKKAGNPPEKYDDVRDSIEASEGGLLDIVCELCNLTPKRKAKGSDEENPTTPRETTGKGYLTPTASTDDVTSSPSGQASEMPTT